MKYSIIILLVIFGLSSCSKDEIKDIKPVKDIVIDSDNKTEDGIIISKENLPIVNRDRQEIKRHLMKISQNVTYDFTDGICTIVAKPTKEESKLFSTISYEIKTKDFDINSFELFYVFRKDISEDTKTKVYTFLEKNSKIDL
ncbi:MAG: hypothetical protein N4A32_00390 [Marinifilaceae bacterium]|nr:hypothetical protein [Marinifilaceae bacterium]